MSEPNGCLGQLVARPWHGNPAASHYAAAMPRVQLLFHRKYVTAFSGHSASFDVKSPATNHAPARRHAMTPNRPSLMGELIAEFLGTLVLIALGDGVVAMV